MKKILFFAISILWVVSACNKKKDKENVNATKPVKVDLVVSNATIYTVDSAFSKAEAMAIHEGRVVFVGSLAQLNSMFVAKESIDLGGANVYPGFSDPHCHFLGYARTLFNVDLTGTQSLNNVIEKTADFFGDSTSGWIQGRGWDQNDWGESGWDVSQFPDKTKLDSLFPNNPVALRRVDGHALWVNSMALQMGNITSKTRVRGGEVHLNTQGEPSGILLDNAADLVLDIIPENIKERDAEAVQKAQSNCFAVGLTNLHDAGLPLNDVLFMYEQYKQGRLKIRINQMLSHDDETIDYFEKMGAIEMDHFWVKSIKCYMDGALGSRGAWLKKPYHDAGGHTGLQLTQNNKMHDLLSRALKMNFQVNTHAIGDSAVANTLSLYAKYLKGKNDKRWRIEHNQVVEISDLSKYSANSIIPSVQPTHATSDMYWADERLGNRIETAYAYQDLLATNGWIINGSDFPVEHINPLYGFYAAVARMDQQGNPKGGFQIENALTREQALRAMTIWAAKGAFLEDELGSLEVGKRADFVVLEKDLITAPINELYKISVLKTFINGELVFEH
ncbi:MAG: amidohydrolase [Bacteroidia bacterium]